MSAFLRSTALWYASRGTGVVAMVLLTLVVALGILVNRQGRLPGLPRFVVTGLHRNLSLIAVTFIGLHVLTAVADSYVSIRPVAVLVPFASSYLPVQLGFGAVALDLIIAIVVTSLLRVRIGRRAWRGVHWLGYAAFPVTLLHGVASAKDLRSGGLLVLTVACCLVIGAGSAYRLIATWNARAGRLRSAQALLRDSYPAPLPPPSARRAADRLEQNGILR